ncbi:MAG: AraC family transcriptional regulator [Deltaproteobacteria bacterium]|nr:AraC family transcriptional regulator [Candidatus Tharpella aukensis]
MALLLLKRHLHDNIGDVIQVSDLCRLTGKGERILERVCARAFASSPRALLKSHRLNSVRKDLLATVGKRSNVTHIALEYGFTHPGRFAGEYKKFFGELPSETLFRNRM